ncbi:MAG TPA: hypothetical protein VIU40_06335 [Geobacteraceae bacterium]
MRNVHIAGIDSRRKASGVCRAFFLLMAVFLHACLATAVAAGAGVPKKPGIYLVDGSKNLLLQDAQGSWKLQGPTDPVVVLSNLRVRNSRPTFLVVGKSDPQRITLTRLKTGISDQGGKVGVRFNTVTWVPEQTIALESGKGEKPAAVRLTPKEVLTDGVYALTDGSSGRRYTFGVGDLEKVFVAAAVDPRTYIRVAAKEQKRYDMLGHNLKEQFSARFLFVKDGDIVGHPTNPELKIGVSGFREETYQGIPVRVVTINVVKSMALTEVLTLTADGISFPANIDGCYYELVNQSKLPDNRNQYGFLIHCPK